LQRDDCGALTLLRDDPQATILVIFPLAILFSKLFRSDFMKDRTATGDVLGPAFTSMLLFSRSLCAPRRSTAPCW